MKTRHFILTLLALLMAGFAAKAQGVAYDTNRGFRHPGGLHTQADFDRIKQQLANGNTTVTQAYNVLKSAAYAQPGVATNPVETIVRGGGNGENYINAARGATMAYQNALRWKIEGNEACARAAVRILMAWAKTTKNISGDSNYALAAGLYGYEFAQAAELMRDYEGWATDDFKVFCRWMLDVWYPSCIGFMRGRNGTWENAGKWWQSPGHYWSNWGLCNALCLMSIGVLCDDVFIWNQAMSFLKHDQCGSFRDPRTSNPILNDGLTEFWGNLIVTTAESDLETGAYGRLGQMQESGRDIGHAVMAAGLAVDIAQMAWNQGNDLFAFMDHRLAAGIEYVAAQILGIQGLPWTNYHYASSGYYWSDSRAWLMTSPALGEQIRPYWGTVVGHYEGVKGVQMPFSHRVYDKMGIDAGGVGATSGGYDHLGYSVLMNTRDGVAKADDVPTELSPLMEYAGKSYEQSELGGLVNTFQVNNRTCLPTGKTVTLKPQLPAGEEDTGLWLWNSGETTRDISVTTDRSAVYRVTYTNRHGVKSQLMFSLAVENDNSPSLIEPSISYNGETFADSTLAVYYGEKVTLHAQGKGGFGSYRWQNGSTAASYTPGAIVRDTTFSVVFTNQGGTQSKQAFHINVIYTRPDIVVGETTLTDTTYYVGNEGDIVVIGPYVPSALKNVSFQWSTGETTRTIAIGSDNHLSGLYSLSCIIDGHKEVNISYEVMLRQSPETVRLQSGDYLVRHIPTDTYLTSMGLNKVVAFSPLASPQDQQAQQVWIISDDNNNGRFTFQSLGTDSLCMNVSGRVTATPARNAFRLDKALGSNRYALRNSRNVYFYTLPDGDLLTQSQDAPTSFPFEFIPVTTDPTAIHPVAAQAAQRTFYTLSGIRVDKPQHGVFILREQLPNKQPTSRIVVIK